MTKTYDYSEEIKIDRFSLENAWQEHSELVLKYGDLWSDFAEEREHKQNQVDKIKDEIAEEKARLGNELRKNWKIHEFAKSPTDKSTESWVILQPSYKSKLDEYYKSKEELVDLKSKERRLKAAYDTFGYNQKTSLEHLVTLHLNNYYSEPKVEEGFGMKPKTRN